MTNRHPEVQKGAFVNPHIGNIRRRPFDFFLWLVGYFRDTPYEKVPPGFSYPFPHAPFDPSAPTASWIGHSSYYLSVGGKQFLTDPVWGSRCSPFPFLGPKRTHPPAIPLEALPEIQYVLISHDHYDHLDKPTIYRLKERFPNLLWIVPTGVKKWFVKQGITRVIELGWWQEIDVDSSFKITAVPAQHFSGRKAPHMNKTLWVGYVVESLHTGKCFYFVGDTGYNNQDFKEIGKKFPSIDLSLIPIGAYSPRKFMAPVHIEPKDAVNIHIDSGSKLSLGMHWKTFRLSEEPINQPPFDLLIALRDKKIQPTAFLPIEPGMRVNW